MLRKIRSHNLLDVSGIADIVRGASVTFVLRIVGLALGFALNIAIARTLGQTAAGLYFLSFSVVTLASTIGIFGLKNTVVRFVASNNAVEDFAAVRGTRNMAVLVTFGVSMLVTILLWVLAPWLGTVVYQKPAVVQPLRLFALAVPLLSLTTLFAELLKGLRRLRDSQLLIAVGPRGLPLLGVLLIGAAFGVDGIILVYVASVAFLFLAGLTAWHLVTPSLREVKATYAWKSLFNSCIPLFWMSTLQVGINQLATSFLGRYGSPADVAEFSVALRTATLTSLVLLSVNSDVSPKFAAHYRLGNMQALERTAQSATRLVILLTIPMMVIFIGGAPLLMSMFGAEYVSGANLLIILVIGQFVNAATGAVTYVLVMTGHERVQRNVMLVAACVAVTLNVLLVPVWGAVGAAVATALTVSFSNLLSAYYVYKLLGIRMLKLRQ